VNFHAELEADLHAEDAPEIGPAAKDLRRMRAAVHVAQEMGEALGRGQDLLGSLQKRAASQAR
jgi:hypothetical protein